jgi:hypothetical protein
VSQSGRDELSEECFKENIDISYRGLMMLHVFIREQSGVEPVTVSSGTFVWREGDYRDQIFVKLVKYLN